MTTVAEAFVTLRPDFSKFKDEAEEGLGGLGDIAKKAALGIAGAGAALTGIALVAVKAAADEEVGIKRLSQAVVSNGGDWDKLGGTIEGQIAKWEKLTAFSDGEMRDALATLTNMTGDANEAMKRLPVAMDFARGAGIDLETASRTLGKVTDENTTFLKKYGIEVDKGATSTEVLQKVQETFAGQSKGFAESATGKWTIFQNQVDNLKEDVGVLLLPAFSGFVDGATKVIDALRSDDGPIAKLGSKMAGLKDIAKGAFDFISGVVQTFIATLQGLGTSGGDAADAFLEGLYTYFGIKLPQAVQDFTVVMFNELRKIPGFIAQVVGSIGEMFDVLTGRNPSAGGVLRSLIGDKDAQKVQGTLATVRNVFSEAFDFMKPIIQAVIDKVIELKDKFDELPPVIQKFAGAVVVGQVTGLNDALLGTGASLATMASGFINVVEGAVAFGPKMLYLIGLMPTWIGLQGLAAGEALAAAGAFALEALPIIAITLGIGALIAILAVLVTDMGGVRTAIGNFIGGALEPFVKAVQDFFAPFGQWLDLFKKDAPYAIGIMLGAIVSLPGKIIDTFFDIYNRATKLWGDLWINIWNTLRSALGNIKDSIITWGLETVPRFIEWGLNMVDEVNKLPVKFLEAAGKMVAALVQGIIEKGPDAVREMFNFGGRVLQGFRDAIGWHSPPQAFVDAGYAITDALAMGIEGGSEKPVNAISALGTKVGNALSTSMESAIAAAQQMAINALNPNGASLRPQNVGGGTNTVAAITAGLTADLANRAAGAIGANRTLQGITPGGVPYYKLGTPFVPEDQLAFLHRGERVMTRGDNEVFTSGAWINTLAEQMARYLDRNTRPVSLTVQNTDPREAQRIVERGLRLAAMGWR